MKQIRVKRRQFQDVIEKARAFDEVVKAIESNHIKVKVGWAFDVYEIYKKYKAGVKDEHH